MWSLNINEENKLLNLKISDTLTLNELSEILKEIYDKNDGNFATYNRFTDLSALKEIKIVIAIKINDTKAIKNIIPSKGEKFL